MTRRTVAPVQVGFDVGELRAAIGDRLFLTVSEVADLTRVDERTVRRAIEADTFPGIRIGNVIRVPAAAFLQLAATQSEDETASVGRAAAERR